MKIYRSEPFHLYCPVHKLFSWQMKEIQINVHTKRLIRQRDSHVVPKKRRHCCFFTKLATQQTTFYTTWNYFHFITWNTDEIHKKIEKTKYMIMSRLFFNKRCKKLTVFSIKLLSFEEKYTGKKERSKMKRAYEKTIALLSVLSFPWERARQQTSPTSPLLLILMRGNARGEGTILGWGAAHHSFSRR